MRITSREQVTIPVEIRGRAGLLPHNEGDCEFDGRVVSIVRAKSPKRPGRGALILKGPRGHAIGKGPKMTTDEIMALTPREDCAASS